MLSRCCLTALILAAVAGIASAADEPLPVTVHTRAVSLSPGGAAEAVATVTIQEGYRIQANPTPGRYLLPTMLLFPAAEGIHAEGPVYPPGKPFHLEDDDFQFSGYQGKIEIRVPIKASSAVKPGDYTLNGHLRYQLSTSDSFLRKATLPVTLQVHVTAPATRR